MNRVITIAAATALAISISPFTHAQESKPTVLGFVTTNIDGQRVNLSQYKGDVLLIVNTASQCGLTPQYEALEGLYQKYGKEGFKVLAFPANEFGAQEPGTNKEIKSFCESNYKVSFPLFSKIVVKGDKINPIYKFLTSEESNPKFAGPIQWNFTKFLVDREGQVIARFEPKVEPDSPEVIEKVEAAIAVKK
jgi:glutathione peroxidase